MPPEELELDDELDEEELLELEDDELLELDPPPKLPFRAFTTAGNQALAIFS